MGKNKLEVPMFKSVNLLGIMFSTEMPLTPRTRRFLSPYYKITEERGKYGLIKKNRELTKADAEAFLARRALEDQAHSASAAPNESAATQLKPPSM